MEKKGYYRLIYIAFAIVFVVILFFALYHFSGGRQEINEKPVLVPVIAEWKGGRGVFKPRDARIVIAESENKELWDIAEQLKEEYLYLTGYELSIEEGKRMKEGDILLGYSKGLKEYDDGSYTCDIGKYIVIEGKDITGVYWGTRTIVQMLVLNSEEIPKGKILDYPEYKVRGIGIDVARHPLSIESLKAIIQMMSFFKMNDLQIHLNDNMLMQYSDKTDSIEHAFESYSAFRMESVIANESGEGITSSDYYYTAEEFTELVEYGRQHGVNIVPEIDSPAHALAITSVFPELAVIQTPGDVDRLDVTNEQTLPLIKSIWDEQEEKAFKDCSVLHLGIDEAYIAAGDYRNYANELIQLIQGYGKTARMWGSLSWYDYMDDITSENVQVNIWNTRWANPVDMYNRGFSLINTQNRCLYIIPGGGWDYLDTESLYNDFEPNIFIDDVTAETYEFDIDSPQMSGACFFVWNDFCGNIDIGISEYDIIVRIMDALPWFAQKVWGQESELKFEEFEEYVNAVFHVPCCELFMDEEQGGKLYPGYSVEFDIVNSGTMEDGEIVLFESETEYGRNALIIGEDRRLGFLMENREYYFDYTVSEDVSVKLEGDIGVTRLYINGIMISEIGSNIPMEMHATLIFPLTGRNDKYIENFFYSK